MKLQIPSSLVQTSGKILVLSFRTRALLALLVASGLMLVWSAVVLAGSGYFGQCQNSDNSYTQCNWVNGNLPNSMWAAVAAAP